nr:hypothetical protein Iba_chr09cCG12730 [Ipomoea batatas]
MSLSRFAAMNISIPLLNGYDEFGMKGSIQRSVLGAIQEVASAATAVTAAASNPLSYVHTFRISILSPRRRRYLLRNLRPSRDCRLSLSPQRGDRRRPVTAAFDRP